MKALVLAGIFYFYSLAAHFLYELLADEAGMPRGATCHDDDASWVEQVFAVVDDG